MAKRIVVDVTIKERPMMLIKKPYVDKALVDKRNMYLNQYNNSYFSKESHNILITSVVNKNDNLVNLALCTNNIPPYRLDIPDSYMNIENCAVKNIIYFITKDKQLLKVIPENFDYNVKLTFEDMIELADYLNNIENKKFKVLFWDDELSLKLCGIKDREVRIRLILDYMKELGYNDEDLEIHHDPHKGGGLVSFVYIKFGEEFINKEIMLEMAKCPSNPKIVSEKLDEFFLGFSKKDNLVEDLNNELLIESVDKDVKNLLKSFPELE